jgi:phage terminase large subunit
LLRVNGTSLELIASDVFLPFADPALRYLLAHGGRGSGKSHHFAERLIKATIAVPGTRAVCIREYQRSLKQSSKHLIESKIKEAGLGSLFDPQADVIRTPGDGLIMFAGMQDHNAETIKSLEACRIACIDEAQTLSERSLAMLRPTIRLPGSQIWASYNRTRKRDAIDVFARQLIDSKDHEAAVVLVNWRNNPWWNPTLEKERLRDLRLYPERYDHIWEGDYAKAFEGAYFARQLAQARLEKRIGGPVPRDPLLPLRTWWDLGGAGAQADAMAIWVGQWVGMQIRLIDYIEGVGQPLEYYLAELRSRGYDKAIVHLPHDGVNTNSVTGNRIWQHIEEAGFDVPQPLENQGRGAVMMRIEAARRVFPACWFDPRCEQGLDALGYYHERKDEQRQAGLGPEHDWSSHGADAFGLMALLYEGPERQPTKRRTYMGGGGWQAA